MPDLKAKRGDSNIYNVVVLRQDKTVNITGAKVWFTAKRSPDAPDSDAIIQLDSTGPDIIIYDALRGRVQITIPPSLTASLDDDVTLYYDVQLKEAGGAVTTIAEGKLAIELDITQAVA